MAGSEMRVPASLMRTVLSTQGSLVRGWAARRAPASGSRTVKVSPGAARDGDVGGESGVAGLILGFVVVEPVDDGVAGGVGFGVGGRKEDAVGASAGHDLAAVGLLLD